VGSSDLGEKNGREAYEKQFLPQARRMNQKNGTLGNNNGGGGGFTIPRSAKVAASAYVGYKIGKSSITG